MIFVSKFKFFFDQNLDFVLGSSDIDDGVVIGPQPQPVEDGIAAFNRALKKHVPKQLPLSGMRSWKLLGYKTSILVFGIKDITAFYDLWSWRAADSSDTLNNTWQDTLFAGEQQEILNQSGVPVWYTYDNFRSVLGLLWQIFILGPLNGYLIGCMIKASLAAYAISGWPSWTKFGVFMPLMILVENFFCYRQLVTDNLRQLIGYQLIAAHYTAAYTYNYCLDVSWIYGSTQQILVFYFDWPTPGWLATHKIQFDNPWWVQFLLWIFVAIPVTIFTYWIYEPRCSRDLRADWSQKFLRWWYPDRARSKASVDHSTIIGKVSGEEVTAVKLVDKVES